MSLKRTNEAADLIIKNLQYGVEINHFSRKTQGIVGGGKIKDTRNCGYARMEELRCAGFHVLSPIGESKDESYREQQESQSIISNQNTLVESHD